MTGQVAFVSGAGTGIGAAIAARLGADGYAVGVNALTEADAAVTVRRVEHAGGRALALPGDVSNPADVEVMLARCVDELGGAHVAVNNAGVMKASTFFDLDISTWREHIDTDLTGAFLVARAAGAWMAAHGGGVIVNVTSVHEHVPRPRQTAYCVAKAGLGMLTKCLGAELASYGIRVIGVAPGAIDTAMNAAANQDEEELARLLADIPAGRMGRPEEVADLVAWVVSPAAAYLTATTIVIDGGLEQDVVS